MYIHLEIRRHEALWLYGVNGMSGVLQQRASSTGRDMNGMIWFLPRSKQPVCFDSEENFSLCMNAISHHAV